MYRIKKYLVFIVSLILFGILSVTFDVYANPALGLNYTVEYEERKELAEGLLHIHAHALSTNDAASQQKQNVNVLIKDVEARNIQVVSWAKFVNGKWRLAPLHEIAKDFEEKNPGWSVIAGVNGDFFTTEGSINMHMSLYGDILKTQNSFITVGLSHDGSRMQAFRHLDYSYYYLTIYDPETYEILYAKPIDGVNRSSFGEYETIAFHHTDAVSLSGATYFIIDQPEAITTFHNDYFLKGRVGSSSQTPIESSASTFVIATLDEHIIDLLNTKPMVRIQRMLNSRFYPFDTAIGADVIILQDGRILSLQEMIDRGRSQSHSNNRHPRTAIGITEKGDLMLGIIDGRQSAPPPGGYPSLGVSLREMALMMKHYGAQYVYNLDGGGSSQMIYKNEAGEFVYLNSPSEGPHILPGTSYRSDANGLLLVVPDVSVNTTYDHLTSNSLDLTYTIEPAEGVTIRSVEASVNEKRMVLTENQGTLHLDHLYETLNYIQFIVTYEKDGNQFTRSFAHKVFDLEKSIPPTPPTFEMTFSYEENLSNLLLTLQVEDSDHVIETLYLRMNDNPLLKLVLTEHTATHTIENVRPGKYVFKIVYTDERGVETVVDKPFVFTVKEAEPEPDPEPQPEPKHEDDTSLYWLFLVIPGVLVALFFPCHHWIKKKKNRKIK